MNCAQSRFYLRQLIHLPFARQKAFKVLKLSYCRSDHKINIFVVSFISFFATKLCGPSSLKGETAGAKCQLNTDIGLP